MNNTQLFKFNNTNKQLKLFQDYIHDVYDNNDLVEVFSCVNKLLEYIIERNEKKLYSKSKNLKLKNRYYEIINTMRMSFIELI
jgi:hypothetical protein